MSQSSEAEELEFRVLDSIPVGTCVLRSDFTVIFWNRCLEHWTKISRQKILGQDIREAFPPLKTPEYIKPLQQVLAQGSPTRVASLLQHSTIQADLSQGKLRIEDTTITAIPAVRGEEWYTILLLEDVTPITQPSQAYRAKSNQAIKEVLECQPVEITHPESEKCYAKIFQDSPLGMGLINREHQFLQVNTALCQMLGYTETELMKLNHLELAYREDKDQCHHYSQQLFQEQRKSFKIEQRYLKKDGEILWVQLIASLIYHQSGQSPYGLFIFEDITEHKFSEQALQAANHQLTSWINELETRNHEITLLSELSDVLQACFDVSQGYKALPRLIQPLFSHLAGAVFRLDSTDNRLKVAATWGDWLGSEPSFDSQDCWAIRRGRSHLSFPCRSGLRCRHLDLEPAAASLCVPMSAQGKPIGVLYLSTQRQGDLTKAKQRLAVAVAEHIALALANLKLRETLRDQSIRDSLTGLYNRRYLEETLSREIQRAIRKQQSLGVIMIDIDHFKRFNDTYGHEAGDKVLQGLSVFIQENIRSSDVACRYGGEELTLILPDAKLADTKKRAEQLRRGVKGLVVSYRAEVLPTISISVGIGCYPHHGQSWTSLIRAADAALYEAKRQGRDRVMIADDGSD